MLFHSFEFLLVFFPTVLLGLFVLGARGAVHCALVWLIGASLFFYGWWNPVYLLLLGASVLVNHAIGARLQERPSRGLLTVGVALDLGAIGWFKYAAFVAATVEELTAVHTGLGPIVLPLAISFFTFQQIAYLVDSYRGEVERPGFLPYVLFVTFFPQLVAGPIVHHRETIPQFRDPRTFRLDPGNLARGLALFVLGLFKKVVIADRVALYAAPVFDAAAAGASPTLLEAWGGALAYAFQLYFDFSGYSDMAIGLALMMNVRLPVNFDSPYKAVNIVDFWRRWHITLSRFLLRYLYIPLGGNRRGSLRRHLNLMITMLLGGLWHGAGWTFVAWGALHGLMLVVVHAWHEVRLRLGLDPDRSTLHGRVLARALTFTAVVVAWVPFRAESFEAAAAILAGMAGLHGMVAPASWARLIGPLAPLLESLGWQFLHVHDGLFAGVPQVALLVLLAAVVFLLPNSQQWAGYRQHGDAPAPPILPLLRWRGGLAHGSATGFVFAWVLLALIAETPTEFLYFQF